MQGQGGLAGRQHLKRAHRVQGQGPEGLALAAASQAAHRVQEQIFMPGLVATAGTNSSSSSRPQSLPLAHL
eukprot:scaffold142077_cov17-Tisochrysis_lutea.AAC.1